MIGIYKITSPSNKIYIGQSIDIDERWKQYYGLDKRCIGPKLINSLRYHKPENHIFEKIEECSLEQLNERETYWKQHYINLIGWKKVLFCELYDNGGGPKSNETKQKQSEGLKKAYDDGRRQPYWLGKKNPKLSEYNKINSGFKYIRTDNHKEELSEMMKEIWKDPIKREQIRIKMSNSRKGQKPSLDTKNKMSESHKISILQFDKENNFIKEWSSITEASLAFKTAIGNISAVLNQRQKTAKGYIWKYKNNLNLDF